MHFYSGQWCTFTPALTQVSPADRPSEQADLQHTARPRVERQDCRQMEIVLGNGRRLLLPLTVSPVVLKEVVGVLERA